MSQLKFCTAPLPIDALTQPIALLSNRGGGKTYAGTKIFELAYDADDQCGVFDPDGKWWGLRLGANGKPAGGHAQHDPSADRVGEPSAGNCADEQAEQ